MLNMFHNSAAVLPTIRMCNSFSPLRHKHLSPLIGQELCTAVQYSVHCSVTQPERERQSQKA